jgi:hypothetical protein
LDIVRYNNINSNKSYKFMERKIVRPRKTKSTLASISNDSVPSNSIKLDEESAVVNSDAQAAIVTADDLVKSPRGSNKFSKLLIFVFLFAVILGGGIYYAMNLKPIKIEDSQIISRLKTIIILPDVAPTMALVTDANILKNQQPAFFADVKNGDRLIIYPNLAIIYDYEANKIIKVGPVQNAQFFTPTSISASTSTTTSTSTLKKNNGKL